MSDNAILFCIPYAGGSSMSISNVTRLINTDGLDIQCLELPGRGMRSKEPLVSTIDEAMDDLYENVKSRLQNPHQPIIFWGHSLGALLALLLSHKFHQDGYNIAGLIVSGMKAPSFVEPFSKNAVKKHRDSLFSEMMPMKKQSNKESPLFRRAHKKGMEIMEKDIAILEKSDMKNWTEIIIEKPLTVIMGEQDELFPTTEYYKDWKLHTADKTYYYSIPGGHLVVMQHPGEVAALLSQVITNIILN
ncbi:hypothetical protein C1631_009565 [Chryseobacterium phosphatilyticum]|uniref:Thioesterase domain-containing protein n=1 Tax=Chryseobacterium phosphatilyticum TaxID=475075 RepID=A0A316X8X2_9FLAO|nr:alpha/beta fold hydrolase [Chryseobacterium phosphatilyticum]PWN70225.1 hypothetical protein C1631_009565 [Chryseobacterium phosphatilyticum]